LPLLEIWKTTPATAAAFSIEQVVAVAGSGVLTDSSECSNELRRYLAEAASSSKLAEYAASCLSAKFAARGFVLQDIVNELGRRLGFKVENGRYQGTSSHIGFDGIWEGPDGHACVVEVKTSDIFSVNLDTVAAYRANLMRQGRIGRESSTLLVVGNADTGGLEAQVRGSRYAWDMRLISVRALSDLVRLHEVSRSVQTGIRIRTLLTPLEFTRLDGLADILLQTAEETADAREQALIATDEEVEADLPASEATIRDCEPPCGTNFSGAWQVTDPVALAVKRRQIITVFEVQVGAHLVKRSSATYSSDDRRVRLACTISKPYASPRYAYPYWYAFHQNWRDFLAGEGFLALGFMDMNRAAIIPASFMEGLLPALNTTTRANGVTYWHIHLVRTASGSLAMRLRDGPPADLALYMVELASADVGGCS
jgi:hypothetical protein